MNKPEALRLADAIEKAVRPEASLPLWDWVRTAAELRRLHSENELLASAADKLRVAWRDEVHNLMKDKDQLRAQRDALLEALVSFTKSDYIKRQHPRRYAAAIAAIAAVEGEKR